jgi:hypothetical protein
VHHELLVGARVFEQIADGRGVSERRSREMSLRRLRFSGQWDKLRADRSKEA